MLRGFFLLRERWPRWNFRVTPLRPRGRAFRNCGVMHQGSKPARWISARWGPALAGAILMTDRHIQMTKADQFRKRAVALGKQCCREPFARRGKE
jgi:hypothetical protein